MPLRETGNILGYLTLECLIVTLFNPEVFKTHATRMLVFLYAEIYCT